MNKIIFRCNVGTITGTGHLMEILTIHKVLKKKYDFISILVINYHNEYLNILNEAGFNHIEYLEENEFNDIGKEILLLADIKRRYDTESIIIDLFDRNQDYYANVDKIFPKNIIILDSQKIDIINANIVINFSVFQKKEFYENLNTKTQYYIGPEFFILSPVIENYKKIKNIDSVKKIFINQGGSDPYALTEKIIRFLTQIDLARDYQYEIVVGGAIQSAHLKTLEILKSNLNENFKFYFNIPIEKMFEIISSCDAAITAAGNALYELSYFGIPSIIIGHHERHQAVAEIFNNNYCALNLGIGSFMDLKIFEIGLKKILNDKNFRKTLSDNSKKFIDGKGLKRIEKIIIDEFDLK